jgi:glutathione S-transferase
MPAEPLLRITGRSSSHFTRVVTLLAHELGLSFELDVVHEPLSLDAGVFGGNPAMKIPVLHAGGERLFGTENICRKLVELAPREPSVVLAEHVRADVVRNAQELVWTAMSAQVQLRIGVALARLDAENVFFAKARAGLSGALAWLEAHLPEVLAALPAPRTVSLFEVTLFCLLEHVAFLPSVPVEPRPRLAEFVARFGERESARRTRFHFDARPTKENP